MELKGMDIVILLMIFQLSIFSFFLLHKGRKSFSNVILALFFIAQIIGIAEVLFHSLSAYFYATAPSLVYIGAPFKYLWAPLMYIYVKSLVYSDFSFKKLQVLHLVPFFILSIFLLSEYHIHGVDTKRELLEEKSFIPLFLRSTTHYFLYLQVFSYNMLSLITLEQFKRKIKNEVAAIEDIKFSWLKLILYGYVVASISNVVLRIPALEINPATGSFLILLAFLIFFTLLFYKALINPDIFGRTDENSKYKTSSLSTHEAKQILERLEHEMQSNKPFLDPAITIKQLAKELAISDRILSQIINEYKQQNFYDFINYYRINFAKKLLINSEDAKKTVLEILYEAGFNSKSAFNLAFKKGTGITPTQFRKKRLVEISIN